MRRNTQPSLLTIRLWFVLSWYQPRLTHNGHFSPASIGHNESISFRTINRGTSLPARMHRGVAIPSTTSCLVGLRQSLAKAGQTTNRGATARAKTPHQGRENESDGTNHHPDAITGRWSTIELDLGDGIFRMEKIQKPARVGRLRGSDADTVRQWFQSAGARD